jgi:geranylgeranyl reductase family protein
LYEAIVIGAGPVGSYLAEKLARQRHGVLVLEKKSDVGEDVCCTGIIGKECLDLLSIDKNLILNKANSARFIAPSGMSLRLWRNEDVAYVLDRPALNRALARHAQAAGVDYLFQAQVTDIQPDLNRVCVHATQQGKARSFDTQVAIVATGYGSPLPEKLGLGRIGNSIIGAQAEVQMEGIDEVEVYLDHKLAPGGFAWLVPTKDGKGLAGMMTRQQPKKHLKRLLASLKAQGKITSEEVTCGYGVIPLLPLPRTYANRILAVGEAAGQVKPTTGGGICYGLLCADIAADILQQALAANDFSASRLVSYQKRWQARLKRELSIGYLAHRIFRDLGNKQLEMLLNFVSSCGVPRLITESKDFSFDWHGRLILKVLRHLILGLPAQSIASFSKQPKKHNQTIPL